MISNFLSNDLSYAIAMTLVHSIWQIALVAILLSIAMRIFRNAPSAHKYFISVGALCLSIVITLVTFGLYYINDSSSIILSSAVGSMYDSGSLAQQSSLLPFSFDFAEKYIIVIVNAWIIGSLLFLIRFSGAYLYLKHIINNSSLENVILLNALRSLKKKYDIHRNIIIKESKRISTPMVMGYIKPVILFPVGLANQLNIKEVEAILAHELAHIKRHDFLFNLLQSFAEILFYYHPAIWYISSRIRFERENCCDDLAIEMTENSISYAKTLVKLQGLKQHNLQTALAFSGNNNQFSQRILRILNIPVNASNMRQKLLAFILVFTSVFAFAKTVNSSSDTSINTSEVDVYIINDCPQDSEEIPFYLDTIPDKKSFHITKKTNEEELELEMENGGITQLKINGDVIPEDEYDNIILELSPNEERDIITVFPDCDKDIGNIFFKDRKFGRTIKIDSLLNVFEGDFEFDEDNVFHFDREGSEDIWITGHDGVKTIDISKHIGGDHDNIIIRIDSVMDLLPGKFEWRTPSSISANKIIIDDGEIIIDGDSEIELKYFGDKERRNLWSEKGNNDYIIELKQHLENEKDHIFEFKRNIEKNHEKNWAHKKYLDAKQNYILEYNDKLDDNNIFFYNKSGGNVSDVITNELLEDGLIQPDSKYKLELSGKHLKINGDKQPANIWEKYKKLYQDKTGIELTKKSKIEFEISANKHKQSYIKTLK